MRIITKLIPTLVKLIIKSIYYYLLVNIKADNSNVLIYLNLQEKLYKEEYINKIIKIRFFNINFFIPKTINNAQIIIRSEKEKLQIKKTHEIFLKPTTYIDIGANIGYWTFSRNHLLNDNIKFYCFEPSSLNFKFLHKNLNRYKNIEIVNCALGNKT